MFIQFENFAIWKDEAERPFMVAIKDRTVPDWMEERYCVAPLSTEEAKRIYEELGKYF